MTPKRTVLKEFGIPRVLLPVVHVRTESETMACLDVAEKAGCRGAFLIGSRALLKIYDHARNRTPLKLGLNMLGGSACSDLAAASKEGFSHGEQRNLQMLWCDDAEIDERREPGVQREAAAMLNCRVALDWTGLYFGGVAFKYKRIVPPTMLATATEIALRYVDVVCTSGPATGMAPSVLKVQAMSEVTRAAGASLALASGVTAGNVKDFLPHVDAFLVGTSIERRVGTFDLDAVKRLRELIEG